ncbi:MAG TPA: hypothetical protein VIK56_14280 [Rhodoferax sp.]
MKIVSNLGHLEGNAKWAIDRSIRLLSSAKSLAVPFEREERMTFAIVNLLNTWANFQRTYFICCLLGARSSVNSQIQSSVTGSISTIQEAIGKAVLHFKPSRSPRSNGEWDSRDEPTWHDANTLLKLSTAFSFTNDLDIQTAFSFGFTAHRNLVVFRNYYAHKNRGTKSKAQAIAVQYLIPQKLHPTAILLSAPSIAASTSLIQMWAEELSQTVELLCS